MNMLKKLCSFSLLMLCLTASSQTNNPAPFCAQTNSLGPNSTAPITNVTLGTATNTVLNNTSLWGSNGWDYTYYNNLTTHTIVLGVPQFLSVTFGSSNLFNNRYFSVYIDLDGDNQFAANERIFDNALAGNVGIPTPGVITFTYGFTLQSATASTTRMRVVRGGNPGQTNNNFVPGFVVIPCPTYTNAFLYGEVEDYNVAIAAAPATANFNLFLNSICVGATVSPIDQSSSNLTAYSWIATGAVPATSTLQAPQFVYTTPGIYSISLAVSNATSNSAPVIKTITVNPTPTLNVLSSVGGSTANVLLCRGRSTTLTASGATTYSWSTGAANASAVVSPTTTSSYNVVGTNTFGCSFTAAITVSVQNCTDIATHNFQNTWLTTYPNPSYGKFQVNVSNITSEAITIEIYDHLGKLLISQRIEGDGLIDLSNDAYRSGLYFVKLREINLMPHKIILMKN